MFRKTGIALRSNTIQALFAFSVIALFASIHNDDIWSAGMDFPHHVALVSYIAQHAALPPQPFPALSEMARYPPGSHVVAASATTLVGSPIAALKAVGDISLIGTWMLLGYMLSVLPRSRALFSFVLSAALVALNKSLSGLAVIGDEIIINEFYSQLIGQALAFLAIAVCLRLDYQGKRPWKPYLVLAVACATLVNFHLLPTAVVLAVFGVFLLLDVIGRPHGIRVRSLIAGFTLLTASTATVYGSTYTHSMIELGQRGGRIPLRMINSLGEMTTLAAATLALALVLVVLFCVASRNGHGRSYLCHKYVGALGISVASLCLLQIGLYEFAGIGSVYACYKYAFLLGTLFIVTIAIVASEVVLKWRANPLLESGTRVTMPFLWAALFGLFSAEQTVHVAKLQSTAALSELLGIAADYAKFSDILKSGHESIAVGLQGVYPAGNYLISIVALGADARSPLAMAPLYGTRLPDSERLDVILTSIGSTAWDVRECRRRTLPDDLVALDGKCVVRSISKYCRPFYDFTTGGGVTSQSIRFSGLSIQEFDGTWSDGESALFACKINPLDVGALVRIEIDAVAFLYGRLVSQQVNVSIGDSTETFRFDASNPRLLLQMEVNRPSTGELLVKLHFPDAAKPSDLGLNDDPRRLGIKIRSIGIHEQ